MRGRVSCRRGGHLVWEMCPPDLMPREGSAARRITKALVLPYQTCSAAVLNGSQLSFVHVICKEHYLPLFFEPLYCPFHLPVALLVLLLYSFLPFSGLPLLPLIPSPRTILLTRLSIPASHAFSLFPIHESSLKESNYLH